VNAGYVVCDHDTKKYHGSLKLSRLGSQVIDHINLRTIVHPYLLRLNEKTNYTCHLGIVNGKMGVYLDKIETGYYGIKLFSEVGKSFPLHCSAMGKILLAFLDPEARSPILSEELISLTSKTITDRAVLERQLDKIRKSGYAVDREETTRGILCVATPIRNEKEQILAAISVTFPSFVEKEKGLGYAIESVRDCTEEISRMLREDVIVSRKITLEITGMSMQNKPGK
jgi:DNA-binding IclR family transcriptional regulator